MTNKKGVPIFLTAWVEIAHLPGLWWDHSVCILHKEFGHQIRGLKPANSHHKILLILHGATARKLISFWWEKKGKMNIMMIPGDQMFTEVKIYSFFYDKYRDKRQKKWSSMEMITTIERFRQYVIYLETSCPLIHSIFHDLHSFPTSIS